MSDIPEAVLVALEGVRASRVTNMLAREIVIQEILNADDDDELAREASIWLYDNSPRYMEALTAMAERRVRA